MDKARNMRHEASGSGFSNPNKQRHMNKHSERHKLFVFTAAIRGNKQFLEKSKKGKVRSLSGVCRALSSYHQHCQMGCHDFTEKQAHEASSSTMIATTKRFKFLNDCNGVHHATVPRKLRSAMKKRRCESMLLDSEKVNHKMNGIKSPKKDSIKKSRKRGIRPHWTPRECVSGLITKDEEEVAETLHALARMFPDSGSNDSSRELEGKSLPENSSILQDLEDNANAAFEDLGTAQDSSPCPERSPREASKISSLDETIGQEQHDLPEREKFLMASHSTTPTINLQAMPMMVKSENSNKVPFHDSELCLATGLNMPRQSRILHTEKKPDVEFEAVGISTFMARDVDCKQEQHMIKDQQENGALWPGLSPLVSAGEDYLQSSATKTLNWMQAAICAYKQDLMESCSSSGKTSEVVIHKSSWKRCAAHVHISHIIRSLEVPKRQVIKEPELYECHQMREHEGSKGGALLEVHNLNGIRNGVTSAPGTGHFAIMRNPHESKNGILQQQQCHYGVISQAAPMPGVCGPQKQSFNILSLSAGSNRLKVDNSYNNKVGSRLEPLSKLQDPYLKLLAQQHGLTPIPTPQSQYGSTYLHQPSVAGPQVRLHQPHYYGSTLCGTHNSSTVSNKQQQSFWALQLAARGRSAVNCNIMGTQYPNWQSGRHDSSAVSPCAQAFLPHSPASLEVLRSKIISISGQQQKLIAPIQDQ